MSDETASMDYLSVEYINAIVNAPDSEHLNDTMDSVDLTVPALHKHEHGQFAMLFKKRRGVIKRSQYCTGCIPQDKGTIADRMELIATYYTSCPQCSTFTPLLEGPHQWCEECQACCKSSTSHIYSHSAGECVACTKPTGFNTKHAWCPICRVCRPFAQTHFHYDEHAKEEHKNYIEH